MDKRKAKEEAWLPSLADIPKAWRQSDEVAAAIKALLPIPIGFLPQKGLVFRALKCGTPEKTRVVIVGQDPYHQEGKATGLAFAVATAAPEAQGQQIAQRGHSGVDSLANIARVLGTDHRGRQFTDFSLASWASQQVLLINSCLTVAPNEPKSHRHFGWQRLVRALLRQVAERSPRCVWLIWGADAKKLVRPLMPLIEQRGHLPVPTSHPSPQSAYLGFLTSDCFTKANAYLGEHAIDWHRR